jgi:hypothetical protein
MGGGSYSSEERLVRAESLGYFTKSANEIFESRAINSSMNPHGVKLREARDSNEHPTSLAIMLALDVTGSMGSVPHHLVKDGLPNVMDKIIKSGIEHPQILFTGVGDHECGDKAPFQVGQFESSDELLDKWLTDLFLEGGGGNNPGESYLLAWYFAGHRTEIDCLEKRKEKGFLFTIGDEPTLMEIPKRKIQGIFGEGQYQNYSAMELLDAARKKYHVFHIHIKQTGAGAIFKTIEKWIQIMGKEHLIVAERDTDVPNIIADTIVKYRGGTAPVPDSGSKEEVIL